MLLDCVDDMVGINRSEAATALQMINDRLHPEATIVLLSLTGSRAFGWGNERYDWDVHGIIAKPKWWSKVHLGERGYDINLNELTPTLRKSTTFWTIYEDLSNPFFIHPDFDFDRWQSFCTMENARNNIGSVRYQLARHNTYSKDVRTALHTYRIMMVPLHFIDTGSLEINIYKCNKTLNMTQIEPLRQAYTRQKKRDPIDWQVVHDEIEVLWLKFESAISDWENYRTDKEGLLKFTDEMKKVFYGSL